MNPKHYHNWRSSFQVLSLLAKKKFSQESSFKFKICFLILADASYK